MTNSIDFLLTEFAKSAAHPAIAWQGWTYSYAWLRTKTIEVEREFRRQGVVSGDIVLLKSDYHPVTVAAFLALTNLCTVIIPMTPPLADKNPRMVELAAPNWLISVDESGAIDTTRQSFFNPPALYEELRQRNAPGLVLFTSGSTGEPKGVVHDFSLLLLKFHKRRTSPITLNFLMFDHWGGLNTLLHCLSNASLVVLPEKRTPEYICELIERHHIELLPTTPSFLNMLLISKAYRRHDMSSLNLISYGAEPMPASTLAALRSAFPNVEMRQTYGLIELGVLRAKSLESGSLWVKVGGEGYDVRVVDGILQIKARSAMLGYINAPSPFTVDGFFITGDRVEVNGDYLRILGRDSDLINVGGQKVFPAEVETVVLEHPAVVDVAVRGEPHPLMGKIVCADILPSPDADIGALRVDIKKFCAGRLEPFKVPVKITFVNTPLQSDRLKRQRNAKDERE